MVTARVKRQGRLRRKARVRKKVFGSPQRPRLSVFKSGRHISAQIINDLQGITLAAASTYEKAMKEKGVGGNKEGARLIGEVLAERAKAKGVDSVVFDRNGYKYHGKVKALADAAREKGLKF